MNLKQYLETTISAVLHKITGETNCPALVNYAKDPRFGDYQANGVMALAKRLGRNPRELGAEVLNHLTLAPVVCKLELAGPGFINLFIDPEFLTATLNKMDQAQLVARADNPQTIVIDYSSPNLAKEMHVGHLRGTIIGDAIARTLTYLGHKVIRHNHFGDWGTQFGMLITYMQELPGGADLHNELANLEVFYRAAKQRFDAEPDFGERARENVVRLQAGDPDCLAKWESFIKVSIAHCQELYAHLDITLTEKDIVPESFYNDRLEAVIISLTEKNLLTESAGARCVFLDGFVTREGDPQPLIVQKSDGGYLYATTDLAAIGYRCKELLADRVLYVVDARQSMHFQQVFATAKLAGYAGPENTLEHVSYGTMMGKDGKPFKTRSGDTIKLVDLCDESSERAFTLVSSKNPDLDEVERRHISALVGIAAVKYADLSKNRNSDYVFDWDSMLSFDGNTAPYLLYAYARIRSIFRKAALAPEAHFNINISVPDEQALALKLIQFAEIVELLAETCLPNQLCLYLYELAGTFMKFYESCPVLKAEGAERESRLGLCQLTARTLKQGLELLGITTLEQM